MAQESRLVISIDARNAERTARDLSEELNNITNNGNKADKQVTAMGGSLRALAGYMAGIVTIGSAINKMDAYTNLQNRLKLVTNSQQALNQATNDTFKIAQNSRQAWESVVQVYQRFSDNAKTLNLNMKQTADLTDTVAKSIAISGASTQAAEASLTQFGQALASGVLRGEEFNSISEQAPALLKAIANGLDVNIGQLRAMAAEGQLTGDIVVKALQKSKESVDELFSRTDMTIGQSLTLLDNQLTKFAENAGGASTAISGSIKLVAENLELISSAAIIAGIGYVTTATTTKALAITASATATAAETAATRAKIAEDVKSAIATTNEAKAHLALVQATNAATQAKFGATAANGRYVLASNAVTAAVTRQAAAEKAAQAATATSATIGRSLLGVLGGPVGIGLTVASLAAGYLLMRDNTAQANEKLREQAELANMTATELRALEGVQKKSVENDLAEVFEAQNKALKESNFLFNSRLIAIQNSNRGNNEIISISNKVRTGMMSQSDAIKELNKLNFIEPAQFKQLQDAASQYEINRQKAQGNADAQKILGFEVKLMGNEMQNAVGKIKDKANATSGDAEASRDAAKANREYTNSLGKRLWDEQYKNAVMINHNKTQEEANLLLEARRENEKLGIKGVTNEQKKLIAGIVAEGKTLEARNKAISDGNKAESKEKRDLMAQEKKEKREAEKDNKQVIELQKALEYEYANQSLKAEIDLANRKADIRRAFASDPKVEKQLIDIAQKQYDSERELYELSLSQELYSWKLSEEKKLKLSYKINLKRIKYSNDFNDNEKKSRIKSLQEITAYEIAQAELSRQQREFQAREQFMSETDRINERYRLEEGEILKINDEKERAFMLEMNRLKKQEEERVRIQDAQKAWGGVQSTLGGTTEMDQTFSTQFDQTAKSQELFDSQLALAETAAERERIWQEHENRMIQIEQSGANARRNLTLDYAQGMIGGYAEMFKSIQGEQSTAYRAMFAVQKAFAIAQVLMNAPESYSKAYNAMVGIPLVGPFIAPAAGVAAVALQLAQAAQIKSVKAGFQSGGYTGGGGVSEIAGVVHGQEYVLNANATKRVGKDTLDAINSGGDLKSTSPVNIIINPPSGYEAITKKDGDNVTIDIVEKMIDRSWDAVSNPNSNQSRAMQSAFALQPNRNN